MITDLRGVNALRQLRIEHQESAGLDFPEACQIQMLFLYDVCKSLGLSLTQAQHVLGAPAYKLVTDTINGPVGLPTELAEALLNTSQRG